MTSVDVPIFRFLTSVIVIGLLLSTPVTAQMHDHATTAEGDGQFNPFVVSDNHGGFYTAYVERQHGQSNVILEHSQQRVRVNDQPADGAVRNENPPKVAVGTNNSVFVVWASERERWKGNIRFARSLNGGRTFESAISLNSDTSGPPISRAFESIVVDSKGRIYVAWIDERDKKANDTGAEIWIAISDDQGKTFSHDRKILSNVCECCRTTLAVDSAGHVYLSYRLVPASGPMFRDIAIARSDDGGKSFKPSIVNHDGWELNACPIDGAAMTIDAADRIHVAWFTQTGETPRLYVASSKDRGASFSKPVAFDPDQKLAKHAHIVALQDGRLLIAWDDLNAGSLVKWGTFDPATQSLKLLGTQRQASYPIIAKSGNRISIVALQQGPGGLFRHLQATNF